MNFPEIKICGLTRRADAELVSNAPASYGGAILARGGKRSVTAETAAEMFRGLPFRRVGVFVDAGFDEIEQAAKTAELDIIQLHGSEPAELAAALRDGGRVVWKAVRIREAEDLLLAIEEYQSSVDALHLDGWAPDAPGGTGMRFDWDALAAVRDQVPPHIRLVIAGGLRPENVGEAISMLRPDVVDVSSGVEISPGVKDPAAIAAFISAASLEPR